MRFKLIILLALIGLASAGGLAAYPAGPISPGGCNCIGNGDPVLVAYQSGSVSSIGYNCIGDGNPNPVEVSVSVANPFPRSLRFSYEYYDSNINLYRQGSWIRCGSGNAVLPYSSSSCLLVVYSLMGGLNSTSNIKVLLIGTDGFENYTTSLNVQVSHQTSPLEVNLLLRLQDAENNYNQLANSVVKDCYGDSCCGMLATENYLSLASGNLSAASLYLRECQLSSSWDYIMNAYSSVSAANQSFTQLNDSCTTAVSLINSTGMRIASVANTITKGEKCGSDVALSKSQLSSANNSLNDASHAIVSDDYTLALSKLIDANNSIRLSASSIGKCYTTEAPPPAVVPTKQNSTNSSSNHTSSGDNTALILGGAFFVLIVIAAVVLITLEVIRMHTPRREELPRAPQEAPPSLPPAAPPPAPDIHTDLEKEFNEWLDSHSQKK